MIERNLGNIERLARIVLAFVLLAWTSYQPALNAVEWFVAIVSVMLMLNGVFSRCYLWYVLDIDTSAGRSTSGGACYH